MNEIMDAAQYCASLEWKGKRVLTDLMFKDKIEQMGKQIDRYDVIIYVMDEEAPPKSVV